MEDLLQKDQSCKRADVIYMPFERNRKMSILGKNLLLYKTENTYIAHREPMFY